tara:strand:- start:3131 stop:3478 length:348 start_codon:yes stop_codon:yes gene_type:complete
MKTLKTISDISNLLNNVNGDWLNLINNINKEYKQNIKIERNILLKQLAEDHGLNYEKLLEQYVYKKTSTQIILKMKNHGGSDCFYENKNDSDVYDIDGNIIGIFQNKKITLHNSP